MSEPKPFRQEIFDYFSKNHNLTLTESEMVDIEGCINPELTSRLTNFNNELDARRVDSEQLGRMVDKINAAFPEFKSIMGADHDHAELALDEILLRFKKRQVGHHLNVALKDLLDAQAHMVTVRTGTAHDNLITQIQLITKSLSNLKG